MKICPQHLAEAFAAAGLAAGLYACSESTEPPLGDPPSIVVFEITPAEIAPSGAAVLSWQVTDALEVEIGPGIGAVEGSTFTVRPAESTTYSLRAVNDAGVVIEERDLVVTQPTSPPASPSPMTHSEVSGRALVRWAPVAMASGYVVEGHGQYENGFHSVLQGDATQLFASVPADANALFTFRVAASNQAGRSAFVERAVLAPPGPPEGPALAVVPSQISLPRGGTQCFTVAPAQPVTWVLGSGPFGGEIDQQGCFRAPSSTGATVIIAIGGVAATAVASYP